MDLRNSLNLAFQHLNAFSVPGIGTFRQEYKPARIDHLHGRISPPVYAFSLVNEEDEPSALENFLFTHFKVSINKAKEAVKSIGDLIKDEIKSFGKFVLLGIGEVRKNAGGAYELKADSTPELTSNTAFFGFSELGYSLKEAPVETEVVKKAVVSAPEKKDDPKVVVASNEKKPDPKPVPKPKPEPKPEVKKQVSNEPTIVYMDKESKSTPHPGKQTSNEGQTSRKKKFPWVLVILLLLLIGIGGTGVMFRGQIKSFIHKQGLFAGKVEKEGPESAGKSDGPVTDTPPPVDTSLSVAKDSKPVETKLAPVTKTPKGEGANIGRYPQKGYHYMVVACARDPFTAREISKTLDKSLYNVEVIRPAGSVGFYKVVVYKSKDKDLVIHKMVEWKSDFQSKDGAWIYSRQ